MAKKPVNIEVVQEGEDRFVLITYDDGQTVRCRVDRTRKTDAKAAQAHRPSLVGQAR